MFTRIFSLTEAGFPSKKRAWAVRSKRDISMIYLGGLRTVPSITVFPLLSAKVKILDGVCAVVSKNIPVAKKSTVIENSLNPGKINIRTETLRVTSEK